MEKIVKVTYKVPVLEYAILGWQGTAEMDCPEFETFEKAALIELLCKEILQTVINDYIINNGAICSSDWESFQYDVERYFKSDVITSELFPIVKFENVQYDDVDDICGFSIILSKNIDAVTCENIYLTFEY
jgi:hypothetical protein